LSIEGATELLEGWSVRRSDVAPAPVRVAGALLEQFGAAIDLTPAADPSQLTLTGPHGARSTAALTGWRAPDVRALTAYAALRLAGVAVLNARKRRDGPLPTVRVEAEAAAALQLQGGTPPELIRCEDGWVVVRWREDSERELLRCLTGDPASCTRAEVVERARLARMLIAPVEAPPTETTQTSVGTGSVGGHQRTARRRPRVLDWSVLWAGPWAADQLRRSGSVVQRVEHPRRRDGLLSWPQGRRLWWRLNDHKRIALLDARRACDRERLEAAIADADILITSMTPRALRSLEFDDAWRTAHAPDLLHLELVAFEPPNENAPGLGEHAAAQAGLLWRGTSEPARPAPWADPLLGAAASAIAHIWLASAGRPGGRIRLSLERAAKLSFAADTEPALTALSPASSSRR
jgi:hypothetical protein